FLHCARSGIRSRLEPVSAPQCSLRIPAVREADYRLEGPAQIVVLCSRCFGGIGKWRLWWKHYAQTLVKISPQARVRLWLQLHSWCPRSGSCLAGKVALARVAHQMAGLIRVILAPLPSLRVAKSCRSYSHFD